MGGGNSKSTMLVDTKALNKTTFNQMSKNVNQNSQSGAVVQFQDFSKAKFLSCSADIDQSADIKMKTLQNFSQEQTTELQNIMKNAIKQDLEKQAKQSSGWGATSIADKDESTVKIKTEIENIIDTNISMENLNEQVQSMTLSQEQDFSQSVFDPCSFSMQIEAGIGGPEMIKACQECDNETFNKDGSVKSRSGCSAPVCKFDQNAAISMISEQMGSNVAKAIQKSEVINDVANKIKQIDDQSSQGVGGAFGEIMAGVTGPIKIIAAVICVALCIALAFMLSPAGQNATRTAASKL